jgi:hypothetical protein
LKEREEKNENERLEERKIRLERNDKKERIDVRKSCRRMSGRVSG